MAIPLKESTASQEIPLGYFLDSTDGNTEEDGLTIANTDIKIWKAGATTFANKNSGGATQVTGGLYYCTLDATDTNTVGPLIVFCHMSGALAIRVECVVHPANIYDSLYGTDKLEVDVQEVNGNGTAADNLKLACDNYSATRGLSGTALPAAAADAAGGLPISDAGGLDMDAILADTNELQADWVNGGRLDLILDARASQTSVDTIDDFLDTEIAAILADTNELQTDWVNGGRLDLLVDSIISTLGVAGAGLTAVPWNAAWDAEVQSECTDSLNAYDPPTNAEMELRTLPAADYVVTSDTIAGVTTVNGIAANAVDASALAADAVTEIITAIKAVTAADGDTLTTDTWLDILRRVKWQSLNKLEIDDTGATGAFTLYKDDDTTPVGGGTVTSGAGLTTRTRIT